MGHCMIFSLKRYATKDEARAVAERNIGERIRTYEDIEHEDGSFGYEVWADADPS